VLLNSDHITITCYVIICSGIYNHLLILNVHRMWNMYCPTLLCTCCFFKRNMSIRLTHKNCGGLSVPSCMLNAQLHYHLWCNHSKYLVKNMKFFVVWFSLFLDNKSLEWLWNG
jgi:hypothetical protein